MYSRPLSLRIISIERDAHLCQTILIVDNLSFKLLVLQVDAKISGVTFVGDLRITQYTDNFFFSGNVAVLPTAIHQSEEVMMNNEL